MVGYFPFREELYSEELGRYESYGIRVVRHGRVVLRLSDVSTEAARVISLCRRCTKGQLDPIHLRDVLEDVL